MHPSPSQTWQLQHDVTPGMRNILVEWLFEVCELSLKVSRETYFLAIGILDR